MLIIERLSRSPGTMPGHCGEKMATPNINDMIGILCRPICPPPDAAPVLLLLGHAVEPVGDGG